MSARRWHVAGQALTLLRKALCALGAGAFFLACDASVEQPSTPDCAFLAPAGAAPIRIAAVLDGDSVRLGDGKTLRFAGVNTPEMHRQQQPEQPLARQAKRRLEQILQSEQDWYLLSGARRFDHYGRRLGYPVSASGRSPELELLREGLAFLVVKPPYTAHARCFAAAQASARQQRLGVWSAPYWRPLPAANIDAGQLGYRRLRGVVTRVDQPGAVYLELDDSLVVKIDRQNLGNFDRWLDGKSWRDLRGRQLQVSGWLFQRALSERGKKLQHKPYMLELATEYDLLLE